MSDNENSGKSQSNMPQFQELGSSAPFDPRLMERQMAAITRLLEQREFNSEEEMNAFLQSLVASGEPIVSEPATPLERAQEVVYQAIEATGKRRLELARQALAISPDCADAYVLLGGEETNPQVARRYYELGVEAGERALGKDAFEEGAGEFWGILETRPYMRARQGLAMALWRLDEREPAIQHAREMLRLNPGDNQGMRYQLAIWLLTIGDNAGLEALLAQYPDDWTANWFYNRVLLLHRQKAGRKAETALKRALEVNPFVPLFLLGAAPPPKRLPDYYGFGDENEAVLYVVEAAGAWMSTPGALDWLTAASLRIALTPRPVRARPAVRSKRGRKEWRLTKPPE